MCVDLAGQDPSAELKSFIYCYILSKQSADGYLEAIRGTENYYAIISW